MSEEKVNYQEVYDLFMNWQRHQLSESCALLYINPEEYLTRVFTRLTSKEECDRRQLLPCYIKM